jgi:hypothetical protein
MCGRKRQYAARRGKYAAKSAGVIHACWNASCLRMTLRDASPPLDLDGKGDGYGLCGRGHEACPQRFGVLRC